MPGLLDRLRQWTWPPELRIPAVGEGSACDGLAELAAELAERCRVLPSTATSSPELEQDFVLGLANGLFRVDRNVDRLQAEGVDGKEMRSIRRASQQIRDLLAARGVETRDLTGQEPYEGRLDFEQLGPPQAVPGLGREQIARLERPAVTLGGKLIQTARGVVERPA